MTIMSTIALLMSCFVALIPSRLVIGQDQQSSHKCIKEVTLNENSVSAFDSVRDRYERELESRQNLSNFVLNIQADEFAHIERDRYYIDVCPSQTLIALFWGVPYLTGYKCWNIQPVSHTLCRGAKCQNWNGVPWIQGHTFVCQEKYVYENVWSFCVRGRREQSFVLVKVKISKCCVCTMSGCQ
ncbi:hypothetical protein ACJMK2_020031 [Sinanodonta woodiana]|uniref:Secreted protein n=1 Tax=Sinanodonta woodiana TaxID=1069815 RepID=A0ABD3TY47_SINWO